MADTYSSDTLLGVVRTLKPSSLNFWLSIAFPRVVTSTDQNINFDTVTRSRRMAAFVAPTLQGVVQSAEGFSTKTFKPAYLKPKDVVDPNHLFKRAAGEAFGGTMSPDQRRAAIVADLLATQREMIERRWEWMAAQVVLNGSVVVAGENYPTVTVDFGRPVGHTVTLGSGARWGDAGVKPLDLIESWSETVFQASGFAPTLVVMGATAWAALRADAGVLAQLDIRRGSNLALNIGPGSGESIQYRGSDGVREYWTYNDFYEDASGTATRMMDPRDVLLLNPAGVDGVRAFGAIMDARAGYQAVPIFPKMWTQEDPSAEYVMSQSAPLMVPGRPEATFRARVVA